MRNYVTAALNLILVFPFASGLAVDAQPAPLVPTPSAVDLTIGEWRSWEGVAVSLSNQGAETTVTATVQGEAATRWMGNVNQPKKIAAGATAIFYFDLYPGYAGPGSHTTSILFSSDAGYAVSVPVAMNVVPQSVTVSITSAELSGIAGESCGGPAFSVTNNGPARIVYFIADAPWLGPTGPVLLRHEETKWMYLGGSCTKLEPGVYHGKLTINDSVTGTELASISAKLNVVPPPITVVTPSELRITVPRGGSASAKVTVATEAALPMRLYLGGIYRASSELITASPTEFTIYIDATRESPGTQVAGVDFRDATGVVRARLPIILTITDAVQQSIELSPNFVSMSAATSDSGIQKAQISVINRGAAVDFSTDGAQAWISVSPPSGVLAAKAATTLEIRADPSLVLPGMYSGWATLYVSGHYFRFPVVLTVGAAPQVSVDPSAVSLSGTGTQAAKEVTITSPSAAVQFAAVPQNAWLKFSPESGSIAAGGNGTIRVWADEATTPPGTQNSVLNVTVAGLTVPVSVSVNNNSGSVQPVSLSPYLLSLSATSGVSATPSGQATLFNPGAATSFNAVSNQSWLTVMPITGQLAAGSSASLSIQARTSGLAPGTHNGAITVNTGGQTLSLSVTLNLTPPAPLVVSPTSIEFNDLGASQPARRTITVQTPTGAPAPFTFTYQSPGSWLIAEQVSGQLSVGVNPILLPSSLSTGTILIASVPSDGRTYSVQITARKATTPASWAMPQVADGGDFSTSITLVNPDPSPANATLRFRRNKQDGSFSTEDWRPALLGDQTLQYIRVPAKSIYTLETLGSPAVTSSGWVEVAGPSRLGGFAVFRQTKPDGSAQEATVPMSGAGLDRVVLPYDNASGWVTSFALINRDPAAPLAVNYNLRDSDGRSLSSGPLIILPAAGHVAARFVDMFPASAGKRGSLLLTAPRKSISALALRFSPQGAFTSLETTPDSLSTVPVRQVFAQVADGGGFSTLLTLQNNNAIPVTASIRFRRAIPGMGGTTEPWSPQIEGSASTVNIIIPAGGTYAVRTSGRGDSPASGWAEVESSSPLSGSAVFSFAPGQSAPQEASVALKAGQSSGFFLPFDNTLGFVTSVALANIDPASAARLAVVLRDENGAILGQETLDIPASGHLAFETVNRLAATAGKRGSAEFTIQSGWVAAIGLRFSPTGPFTSFQPHYW